jgi:hypothetical protein
LFLLALALPTCAPCGNTRSATKPALMVVLVGERCLGCTLSRGPQGWEAFDKDERSLGVFDTPELAHYALVAEAAHG